MQDFRPNEFRGVIKSLIPGKAYVFRIQAETKIGFGPEAIWKQKMPILAPPKPSTQVVPTEVCRSSTTIQIRFRKNYFSEQNGAVTSYSIIVAEDDSKNASGLEMPSWRDVQAYSIWPPYQVNNCLFIYYRALIIILKKRNIQIFFKLIYTYFINLDILLNCKISLINCTANYTLQNQFNWV